MVVTLFVRLKGERQGQENRNEQTRGGEGGAGVVDGRLGGGGRGSGVGEGGVGVGDLLEVAGCAAVVEGEAAELPVAGLGLEGVAVAGVHAVGAVDVAGGEEGLEGGVGGGGHVVGRADAFVVEGQRVAGALEGHAVVLAVARRRALHDRLVADQAPLALVVYLAVQSPQHQKPKPAHLAGTRHPSAL